MKTILLGLSAAAVLVASPAASAPSPALKAAVSAPSRTAANVTRDRHRNPAATLSFFGVKSTDTVVELYPGGGWYSEILAPFLNRRGTYWVAAPERGLTGFRKLVTASPTVYTKARTAPFPITQGTPGVPAASADVVLTFRNVHNWAMGDKPFADEAFRQIFKMLKPGGVLGIEEHRLPETADPALEKSSGYMKVSTVRRLAEQAGFRFAGSSEVNANPRDKADYPTGVWTLPPTLRLGDKDRARYVAIGESDRMTLKFVKPR